LLLIVPLTRAAWSAKINFCVIKIYFNGYAFFSVDKQSQTIIVLRYAEGFSEQTIVPSRPVVAFYIYKTVFIAK